MNVDFRAAANELILDLLGQSDRPLTAVEVADDLTVAPATAFQILHGLSGYGLVRRVDRDGIILWEKA